MRDIISTLDQVSQGHVINQSCPAAVMEICTAQSFRRAEELNLPGNQVAICDITSTREKIFPILNKTKSWYNVLDHNVLLN